MINVEKDYVTVLIAARLLQKSNTTINPYFYCFRQKYGADGGCKNMNIPVRALDEALSAMVTKYIKTIQKNLTHFLWQL